MFHISKHFPLCVLKSILPILKETQAFRQLNPRLVQLAGSWIKQWPAAFLHFAHLSERQVPGHGVGLLSNVNVIVADDKTKSLRLYVSL
ncbi:hypothetical protein HMPREF0880_02982 [Yokenella regensburgei ATCC 43003]|nr:hypothetical protein HMPREF0880_02982 [Yokenella regensburgei ATCC 43003]